VTNYYFGIGKGKNSDTAVVNTSTNSTDIEVFVNGANVTDKQTVKNGLRNLIDYLTKLGWPPV